MAICLSEELWSVSLRQGELLCVNGQLHSKKRSHCQRLLGIRKRGLLKQGSNNSLGWAPKIVGIRSFRNDKFFTHTKTNTFTEEGPLPMVFQILWQVEIFWSVSCTESYAIIKGLNLDCSNLDLYFNTAAYSYEVLCVLRAVGKFPKPPGSVFVSPSKPSPLQLLFQPAENWQVVSSFLAINKIKQTSTPKKRGGSVFQWMCLHNMFTVELPN